MYTLKRTQTTKLHAKLQHSEKQNEKDKRNVDSYKIVIVSSICIVIFICHIIQQYSLFGVSRPYHLFIHSLRGQFLSRCTTPNVMLCCEPHISAQSYLICYIQFHSLTKRSFKGFLISFLKTGLWRPPRLVPPGMLLWFPRQSI